jgi:hypothetical protein
MKTLYLDLFSGIAGDMFLGALIDLGVDPTHLERELKKLKLDGYHLHVSKGNKSGIAGTKCDVHAEDSHSHSHSHPHSHEHEHEHGIRRSPKSEVRSHDHPHDHHDPGHHHPEHEHGRNFAEIKKLIAASKLSPWVKRKSVAVFQRIAEAEGKIHGMPPNKVHFHEVGAVDSIVDIVGACIALELLGKPRVLASAVTEGVGWVDCAHGRMPVPAPATLAILGARGVGVTQCEEPHELVTPTGAALVAEFAESFGPMENLAAERIGFGLGTRNNKTRPNVLRAVLGDSALRTSHSALDWETDTVAVLETNLDDCTGEVLGHFLEAAMAAGALDVFYVPVVMKKNRPGVLLTVLCVESDADRFSEMILRETTAFGVRRRLAERRKLKREMRKVKTKYGQVQVKVGLLGGKVVQAAPEYESCRALAAKAGVPVRMVYRLTERAFQSR